MIFTSSTNISLFSRFSHNSSFMSTPFPFNSLINSIKFKPSSNNHLPSKPNSTPPSNDNSIDTNEDSFDKDSIFIKAPTAPWMRGPLLVEEHQMLKLSVPRTKRVPKFGEFERNSKALFGKEGAGRGKKAMKKVYQGFEKLQKEHNSVETGDLRDSGAKVKFKFSSETLFGEESCNLDEVNDSVEEGEFVDNQNELENFGLDGFEKHQKSGAKMKLEFSSETVFGEESCSLDEVEKKNELEKFGLDGFVGYRKKEKMPWEENELVDKKNEFEKIGVGGLVGYGKKMPWEKEEKLVFKREKKERIKSAAELNVDAVLLERLRGEAKRIKKWVKVKKAGVTQSVVDRIRCIWRDNELAMIKFDLPLCRNMERAQEITESKTGGLVVCVNKDELFVYRGCNYHSGQQNSHNRFLDSQGTSSRILNIDDTGDVGEGNCNDGSQDVMLGKTENAGANLLISGTLYEREGDRILDGLGPRFIDWWGRKPLPVDADLLPEVVPGFKTPLRRCPPGVRSNLTDNELTQLRMRARFLPTHFVLGRNRKLQGAAVAILKLWEKCDIAKIALKFGVPNTNNEQMANELKLLTGGTLLLRNKFLIILYRGNDFLPPHVADLVMERESDLTRFQHQEEAARLVANEQIFVPDELLRENNSSIGTLSEFQSIHSEGTTTKNVNKEVELELRTQKKRIEDEIRRERRKKYILTKNIEKSENDVRKIDLAWQPMEPAADQEVLTHEERECLRMIGLKMESHLILGRRGVFDGVIEGLHQHWKHKEVVKVITMQRRFPQIIDTAKLLTAESGGILVSIDQLKEGHAIIIYRGKNYTRTGLVKNKLPNKIDAMRRSLLMQRIGSLKHFANQGEQEISCLEDKLSSLEEKIHLIGLHDTQDAPNNLF